VDLEILVENVLNAVTAGVTIGCIYGLMCIGLGLIFQTSPTAETQATALLPRIVDLATKSGGGKPTKVAFVGDNSASSVSFMKAIRGGVAKDLGLTIVADEVFTPPLADATTLVQKIRSGRPDFIVMQSTNVGDDKLLLDKFAERGITASTIPLVGGGGHWTVPELAKVAGKEHLEGVIVGLANWPGKALGDLEKRFIAKTGEPWFGHDSIFPYAHVMIFKEALERTASTDRRKLGETMHKIDLKDARHGTSPTAASSSRTTAAASAPSSASCSGRRAARAPCIPTASPSRRRSGRSRRLPGYCRSTPTLTASGCATQPGRGRLPPRTDARPHQSRVPHGVSRLHGRSAEAEALTTQAALRLPCSSSAGVPSFQGSGTS